MSNFTEILNKRPGEITRPKPIPVGTYLAVVSGRYEQGESSQKKTPFVDIPLRPLAAQDDVDRDQLAEYGELKEIKGRSGLRFFLTEDSAFRLDDFLTETLGIEPGEKTIGERLFEAQGRQFYVTFRHRPSEDGKQMFAEVAGTAKV